MKILIIAFHPRYMTPYSKQYEDEILKNKKYYDIVFWDRFSDSKLEYIHNEFIIHKKCSLGGNKIRKIFSMYYFRKTVLKIICKGSYDKIIVLNTLPAILISDVLLKKFKNNYILDIRDYTYEKYTFYKRRVDHLIESSFFTSISSEGFMWFLKPNVKIYINHNISNTEYNQKFDIKIANKKKITIGFVGVVRYKLENEWLINSLKNSNRYCLSYIGRRYPNVDFESYSKKINAKNCFFSGSFSNEEKPKIYKNIDIINAVYGNKTLEVITALPNKLYDAIIFKKPIIASKGTYLGRVVKKYNLGITVDFNDDILECLEKFEENFSIKKFNIGAGKLLQKVKMDQKKIIKKLDEFINS